MGTGRKKDNVQDWLLDMGPGDYAIAKDALENVATGSITRVIGAVSYGGRDMWAVMVQVWSLALKETGGPVAHVTVWEDGTAKVWPGDVADDPEPFPWTEKLLDSVVANNENAANE